MSEKSSRPAPPTRRTKIAPGTQVFWFRSLFRGVAPEIYSRKVIAVARDGRVAFQRHPRSRQAIYVDLEIYLTFADAQRAYIAQERESIAIVRREAAEAIEEMQTAIRQIRALKTSVRAALPRQR